VGKTAYEFKLRVTIAASGQGRFGQELEFASDCKASGFTPVLMVLDPTPSSRLTDLEAEFKKYGGRAYIGDAAWNHLEEEAGKTMATFIEKYVRTAIKAMDANSSDLLDFAIAKRNSKFLVTMGEGKDAHHWEIARHENAELADSSEEE
jgi:hypothetical protein